MREKEMVSFLRQCYYNVVTLPVGGTCLPPIIHKSPSPYSVYRINYSCHLLLCFYFLLDMRGKFEV